MSTPEIGDTFAILYNYRDYLFRIDRIEAPQVSLSNPEVGTTTLVWSPLAGAWLLPNGVLLPISYVRLIKKRAEFYDSSPTKHELSDLEILIYADLQTLGRLSQLNKYFRELCNGVKNARLYSARIQLHAPGLDQLIPQYTKPDWRRLYFRIERWRDLAKRGGLHKSFYPESVIDAQIMFQIEQDLFRRPGTNAMYKFLLKEKKDEIVIWAHGQDLIPRQNFIEYAYEAFQTGNLPLLRYAFESRVVGIPINGGDMLYAAINGHVDIVEYCIFRGVQLPMNGYHSILFSDKSLPVAQYLFESGIQPGPESFRYTVSYGALKTFRWLQSLPYLRLEDDLTEILKVIINASTLNSVMIEILRFYPDFIINNWIKDNNFTMMMALGGTEPDLLRTEGYLNYAISLGRVTLTEYIAVVQKRVDIYSLVAQARENREIVRNLSVGM